ncbi:MAG: hypothetical protein R3D32_03860 [Nitratireductor sp.]
MADYYSILKKTVSGLPSNTPETRRAVYAKARAAIDRQLRAINPPPSEDTIARQMGQLEQAISQIDEEYAAQVKQTSFIERQPAPASPQLSVTRPAPTVASSTIASPQARPAQVPTQASTPVQGGTRPVSSGTVPHRPVAQSAQTVAPMARPAGTGASGSVSAQVSGQLPGGTAKVVRPVVTSARTTTVASPQGQPAGTQPAIPPQTRGPVGQGRPVQAPSSPAYDSSLDELDNFDRSAGGRAKVRQRASVLDEKPSRGGSFSGLLIGLVLILAMAGGGYAFWRSGALDSILGGNGTNQEAAVKPAEPETPSETAPADNANQPREVVPQEPKENVRLGQDGETVAGEPLDEDPGSTPLGNDTGVAGDTAEQTAPAEPVQQPGEVRPVEDPNAAPATDSAASETAPAAPNDTSETKPVEVGIPAIAQKAYLYEEGTSGAGATRDNAAIVWSLAKESPAEGLPPESVIRGQLDVPGRGLAMQLSIKRNVDEALPASHIIELVFSAPEDFSGGNVDNIARFVMKSNEQARGEGLVAVPAKIDTGYFLIALNNLEQAEETNRKLLLDSDWIDIPLGYTSGRRALVTLEKGALGEKVFRDAFADWDKR